MSDLKGDDFKQILVAIDDDQFNEIYVNKLSLDVKQAWACLLLHRCWAWLLSLLTLDRAWWGFFAGCGLKTSYPRRAAASLANGPPMCTLLYARI